MFSVTEWRREKGVKGETHFTHAHPVWKQESPLFKKVEEWKSIIHNLMYLHNLGMYTKESKEVYKNNTNNISL